MGIFDLHTAVLVLAVSAGGALIGLDRTAVGQFMVSQPFVVGPVAGLVLGDPAAGLIIGVVLELIWVLDLPVGAFVPADATVATVSATAIVAISSQGKASFDLIGFVILMTTGMIPIAIMADTVVRKQNSKLVETAVYGSIDDPDRISRSHLNGLIRFFMKSFVLNSIFIPAGLAGVFLFEHSPEPVHRAMVFFLKALPLLGAALVLNKLSISVLDRSLLAGFGSAAVLVMLIPAHPLMIIGIIVSAGFLWLSAAENLF
jgi:mannose/fructose/N-acetylgalactosamine-specific phosphotransferase system component IIC